MTAFLNPNENQPRDSWGDIASMINVHGGKNILGTSWYAFKRTDSFMDDCKLFRLQWQKKLPKGFIEVY